MSKPSFMVPFQGNLKKTCPAGIWLCSLIHYTFLADPGQTASLGNRAMIIITFNTVFHSQKVRPAFLLPGSD